MYATFPEATLLIPGCFTGFTAQAALSCRPGDADALELLFRAQSELLERGKAQAQRWRLRADGFPIEVTIESPWKIITLNQSFHAIGCC